MQSLTPTERQFISEHLTDDVSRLLLRSFPADVAVKKLVAQIAARQKAQQKVPTWYANPALIFPPPLSVEQASSEATARHKASLVDGSLLIDLTGGMGVDTWAFASRLRQVVYVEQQTNLAELAAYNLPLLGASNVSVHTGDGLALITTLPEPADWLYLDPHRRDEHGGKVVRLDQCEPDITRPGRLTQLLTSARQILLKTSPLIDVAATIRQIDEAGHGVSAVHVVAVQGEVKEVLFVVQATGIPIALVEFNAVNLVSNNTISFRFHQGDEREARVTLGTPERFLYEPNAAVLKAGAFRLVAERFGLAKLAPNTHLYTSLTIQPEFPGRIFVIDHSLKPDRKALQQVVPTLKANLTVRNFPQTVAELRKKLGLQEGGDTYIFATTFLTGDKRLLVCRKVDRNLSA